MINRYGKGAAYERAVKKVLERGGQIVVRSAGSKGWIDLVAINPANQSILLLQCKASKVSPKRRMDIIRKMELVLGKINGTSFKVFCEVMAYPKSRTSPFGFPRIKGSRLASEEGRGLKSD